MQINSTDNFIWAPDELTIDVTEQDIRLGFAKDCWLCPLARALERKAHPHFFAAVSIHVATLYSKTPLKDGRIQLVNYIMPEAAVRFVHNFDTGKPVSPIQLTLIRERYDALSKKSLQDYPLPHLIKYYYQSMEIV